MEFEDHEDEKKKKRRRKKIIIMIIGISQKYRSYAGSRYLQWRNFDCFKMMNLINALHQCIEFSRCCQ